MNVSLTPELELSGGNYFFGTIRQPKMQPVRYNSASEVVREALCLLEEHDSAREITAQGRAAPQAPSVSGYVLGADPDLNLDEIWDTPSNWVDIPVNHSRILVLIC
jgi:hypothetical protein